MNLGRFGCFLLTLVVTDSDWVSFSDSRLFVSYRLIHRESRRLVGEYVMPIEDLVNGFVYEDSVVRAKWAHCDSHSGKNMQWSFKFYEGPFYVPYRSLLAKEVGNLLVAGRCVSASREVLSSLRIQPICACEGQAAGTAAALAATEEIAAREVDAKLLRETLKKDGVVL